MIAKNLNLKLWKMKLLSNQVTLKKGKAETFKYPDGCDTADD